MSKTTEFLLPKLELDKIVTTENGNRIGVYYLINDKVNIELAFNEMERYLKRLTVEYEVLFNYDCKKNTKFDNKEWCVEGLGIELNTYTNYKVCRNHVLDNVHISNSLCSDNLKSYEKLFWITLIK